MFGITLKEVQVDQGLTRNDIINLFDMLNNTEALPLEIEAECASSIALGFITPEVAELLDYDYKESGLNSFIANIMDDMNNESENCQYEFKGIKIWLSR